MGTNIKHADISNIVKQLDMLFLIHYNDIGVNQRRCVKCGDIFDIKDFADRYNNNKIIITHTCRDCWETIQAEKALITILRNFLDIETSHNAMSIKEENRIEKSNEIKWDIINEVITDDMIKMKLILLKLTNKLKNYDAGKH